MHKGYNLQRFIDCCVMFVDTKLEGTAPFFLNGASQPIYVIVVVFVTHLLDHAARRRFVSLGFYPKVDRGPPVLRCYRVFQLGT